MRRLAHLASVALATATMAGGDTAEWHVEEGCRWKALSVSPSRARGFSLQAASEMGVTFKNELDLQQGAGSRVLYAGSGVALGDVDGDGLIDLYFASLQGRNALFRNIGGGKFEEITAAAGVACDGEISRGAVFADIDGNRTLDLLVSTTGNGVRVLLNDGAGKFADAPKSAGTQSKLGSTTVALGDVDGNGTLDLYVANNRVEDIRDRGQAHLIMVQGKLTVPTWLKSRFQISEETGEVLEMGEPDALYLNDGAGHFTQLSWTDGAFLDEDGKTLTAPPLDWGLTATFRDLNGDGAPDLYVCNDYWTPDRIWMNDGKGRFRAAPGSEIRHTSLSSMGVDFADLTRQGRVDGFVVDMRSRDHRRRMTQFTNPIAHAPGPDKPDDRPQVPRNTLLHQRSDGTFAEVADFAGVAASEWAWQPLLIDVDLDGFEDIVISAGHIRDVQDLDANEKIDALKRAGDLVPRTFALESSARRTRQEQFTAELYHGMLQYPPLDAPLVAYRNGGDLRFDEVTAAWGLNTPGVHHGIAMADLDGDGDLDLVVNNLNAVAGIYRNECSAPRVAVRLKGRAPNTQGIGAKVTLHGGAVPMQSSEVVSGGRYLSGCDPLLVFAAGKAARGMSIEVAWRDGTLTTIPEVGPNRLYEIDQAAAQPASIKPPPPAPEPLFTDASAQLAHTHHENDFDDFAREPLLPNRLSRLGPGVAWHDVDGDGRADLIVGGGKDGRIAVLLNDGAGAFSAPASDAPPLDRDAAGLVAWTASAGGAVLLAGATNFEEADLSSDTVRRWDYDAGVATPGESLIGDAVSAGPLALADLEGRGEMTLFVGGRVIPGKYPAPAPSRLFRGRNGKFVLDEKASAAFSAFGLVSGATFSDVNGDGFPDLVVALEWGPVRVFLNTRGDLRDATEKLGLAKFSGWWNGVAAGDFDEDGRMDLLATNWGLNSKYEHRYNASHPLQIIYGDLNGDGTHALVECHYDAGLRKVVPERGLASLAAAMPWLREAFPTHTPFSTANIEEIFGTRLARAATLSATTLSHTLFLNRGNHFDAIPLPAEAQWAPAFGVTIADFDGDGHEDAFLAQNHFSAQPLTPAIDAGRGLLLRGDGKGGFTPMPAEQSGIAVDGEMRGCASADYDGDGRTDLVVSQNGAATKLFHNTTARPGLRIHLNGPRGNFDGLGAQIRVVFAKRRGPIRELHAGSGYWSQDSSVPVLGTPEKPTAVWVRWPGGKVTTTKIAAGITEITISAAQP